jgi:hypothetical protein
MTIAFAFTCTQSIVNKSITIAVVVAVMVVQAYANEAAATTNSWREAAIEVHSHLLREATIKVPMEEHQLAEPSWETRGFWSNLLIRFPNKK